MNYQRLTRMSDLGTLHALDINGEEQPLCELTAIDTDILIRRLYELENKIESGELGDVKEAERRAKVAERALRDRATYCAMEDLDYFSLTTVAVEARAKELYDGWMQQAEKELAEERKDDFSRD